MLDGDTSVMNLDDIIHEGRCRNLNKMKNMLTYFFLVLMTLAFGCIITQLPDTTEHPERTEAT